MTKAQKVQKTNKQTRKDTINKQKLESGAGYA